MCGIVGYVCRRPAQDILLAGLEKLEYSGYDSAGISLLADGELNWTPARGTLVRVRAGPAGTLRGRRALSDRPRDGGAGVASGRAPTGIGHTRWATHGKVTEE